MPTIYAFPNWTTNPYLNLLYLEARSRGWTVSGRTKYSELLHDLSKLGNGDILHIHWTSPFGEGVKNGHEYSKRIKEFDTAMRQAWKRGVVMYWTVHNAVAHQTSYPAQEIELAERLAHWANRVIILNSHTESAVAAHYALPAQRVVQVKHSSYVGVYPRSPGQSESRRRLGIPLGSILVGMVGSVRPYKGAPDLLTAASLLANRVDRVALAIAGDTSLWALREIEQVMPRNVPVFRRHSKLDDQELVTWSSACDVLVFPYRRILNSGSMMLAATLGVPCVLPGESHLVAEYGGQRWISFFDTESPDRAAAIAEAMRVLILRDASRMRDDALRFAADYTPHDMSRDFASLLPAGVVADQSR